MNYALLKIGKKVVSDRLYSHLANYYLHLRKKQIPTILNLDEPKTFNEKILFSKLNNRFEEGHLLADKFLVRDFVKYTLGEDYLISILGIYDNVESINTYNLPKKFVIKATQGSGWNIIVKDKDTFNWEEAKVTLTKWLNQDYSLYGREWQYNWETNKILIEKFLENNESSPLHDYKFFCFNGEPKYIQVDVDREKDHKRNFYDLQWNLQEFRLMYPNTEVVISKPKELEKMISLAKKVSGKLKDKMNFVRVDFYINEGKIYFGEITFHPDGGCAPFFSSEV